MGTPVGVQGGGSVTLDNTPSVSSADPIKVTKRGKGIKSFTLRQYSKELSGR